MSSWTRPSSVPFPSTWAKFQGRKETNGVRRQYWIQDVTDEYVNDVVKYMTTGFVREEALCKYSGIGGDAESVEECAQIWRIKLSQNVGLICLTINDKGATEIAGMNCTYVECKDEPEFNPISDRCKRVYETCKFLHGTVNPFATFGLDCYLGAMGLYVPPGYRGEGIGEELLRARESLCRGIGLTGTLTNFTSVRSQVLAARVGFRNLFAISYHALQKVGVNFRFPGIEEAGEEVRFMYLLYDKCLGSGVEL